RGGAGSMEGAVPAAVRQSAHDPCGGAAGRARRLADGAPAAGGRAGDPAGDACHAVAPGGACRADVLRRRAAPDACAGAARPLPRPAARQQLGADAQRQAAAGTAAAINEHRAEAPRSVPGGPPRVSMASQLRFWLVLLLVTLICVYLLRSVLLPFVAGMAVAYLLDPVCDRLERWRMSRTWATVLVTVCFVLICVLVLLL